MKSIIISAWTLTLLLGLGVAPLLAEGPKPAENSAADSKDQPPVKKLTLAQKRALAAKKRREERNARGSSSPPEGPRQATDQRSSQRAVCQSQCNLERMSCDQGRAGAYQNRSDQIQAAQSSCYLAVQSCLSRC